MTEINKCKSCKNHCCRRPLITESEIINIRKKYGIILAIDNNETNHLNNIYKYRIRGPICQLFGDHGCILDYNDRPVICKLYPWIPYQFVPPIWELLLDVDRCGIASFEWSQTYDRVKQEFDKILKENKNWR